MHPHHLCNHFNRAFETESLARANIHFHDAQLARDLLWRKAFSKQMKDQLETFIAHDQLSGGTANFTALASVSLCDVGNVTPIEGPIATELAADSRGTSAKHSSYLALTKILILPDLDRGALFDAEFCIGHGGTLPEGEVLHSVFAAAHHMDMTTLRKRLF